MQDSVMAVVQCFHFGGDGSIGFLLAAYCFQLSTLYVLLPLFSLLKTNFNCYSVFHDIDSTELDYTGAYVRFSN